MYGEAVLIEKPGQSNAREGRAKRERGEEAFCQCDGQSAQCANQGPNK